MINEVHVKLSYSTKTQGARNTILVNHLLILNLNMSICH